MNAQIYIKPTCPFCQKALALLKEHQIPTEVFDVADDPELRAWVSESVGGFKTVPMVFIDENFVGGCDDLVKFLA